ncbi:putative POX domain/homeobox DNA-binding domain family protein [Iris pallida]|uniref:POX domain/homeobox DNA-binding domain family protein n=1 Tax=Iris pallida TaxID=29817 RepID=A0AAX6ESB0_IRIPA|nr:putative POX domain/homeobox DNA-binding domain family protein [Iris pallida]KAJ6806964.1 putative POX domain/homeobox DNA-binding domain family protein [Iris pallida]
MIIIAWVAVTDGQEGVEGGSSASGVVAMRSSVLGVVRVLMWELELLSPAVLGNMVHDLLLLLVVVMKQMLMIIIWSSILMSCSSC